MDEPTTIMITKDRRNKLRQIKGEHRTYNDMLDVFFAQYERGDDNEFAPDRRIAEDRDQEHESTING